jgi:glycyl-tRNA synthetase
MEFFCSDEESMKWYEYWRQERLRYYHEIIGFKNDEIKIHEHETLAHYAKAALDIEFKFPFGWGELEGIHHRGTWDMSRHQEFSGISQEYFDQESGKKFIPTVVETSVGVDRTILAILCQSYDEDMAETKKEGMEEDLRIVLRIKPRLAPVQIAVLPLAKKIAEPAEKIYKDIRKFFRSEFDLPGSIGKRYRRQDEIGTPFCLTYDFQSLEDNAVTVRNRDDMTQERVSVSNIRTYLEEKIYA